MACKEQKAREFGIHVYTCLFEEFTDTYSRQEVSDLNFYLSPLMIRILVGVYDKLICGLCRFLVL